MSTLSTANRGELTMRLRQTGLSVNGAVQLLEGQIVSDPADRAQMARLAVAALPTSQAHPPGQVPPAPPVPLPPVGPIMLGRAPGDSRGRPAGTSDSIWIDLGFPVPALRQRLHDAGMSPAGTAQLLGGHPLMDAADRAAVTRLVVEGLRRRHPGASG